MARFNPPPGWPSAPDGGWPPAAWRPEPTWPPPPKGWPFYIDDHTGLTVPPPPGAWSPPSGSGHEVIGNDQRRPSKKVLIAAAVVLLVLIALFQGDPESDNVAEGSRSSSISEPSPTEPSTEPTETEDDPTPTSADEQPSTSIKSDGPTPSKQATSKPSPTPEPKPRPTPKPSPTPEPKPRPTPKPEPKTDPQPVRYVPVIDVVDGDTVYVAWRGETSIRVIGIDTPETVHPTEPVECWGPKASEIANELLAGKQVHLVFDPSQGRIDAYGRTLAYLEIRGLGDFGLAMIKRGAAAEYTYDTAYARQFLYQSAEQRARTADRGLWGVCGGPHVAPTTPPPPPPTTAPPPAPTTGTAPPPAPTTAPPPPVGGGGTDPRFTYCYEANDAGYGPYYEGQDPEYQWYDDADSDGIVCET